MNFLLKFWFETIPNDYTRRVLEAIRGQLKMGKALRLKAIANGDYNPITILGGWGR